MQNNFEKNVQQKMDELKLTPSANVWERVEMEIQPEKRKRRGIFWLLLAALLLLGGGWWLHLTSEKGGQKTIVKNSNHPHRETAVEPPATLTSNTIKNKQGADTGKASSQMKTSVTKLDETVSEKTKPVKNASFVSKRKGSFETQSSTDAVKTSVNKKPETTAIVITAKTAARPIENNRMKTVATLDSTVTQTFSTQPLLNSVDSVATKKEEKEVSLPNVDSTTKNNDSLLKKKVASAGKWRRQLTFGAGISGYAEGPFFQSFNSSQNVFGTSALITPNMPVVVFGQSSPVRSGFHFSLGFSVVKSLSQRWEVSIGLQYAYASTHQKVGDKKTADTTVQFAMDKAATSGFYTNTGTADYTARFHFVELPVSLSFKPSLRLPLYVSVGAAYGRLLATNALTFSSASNLYYQNKENYLRNAVNISSSVQVAILTKKNLSLRTGPFVQYNAVKLRKENGNGTPHLLTAGVKTAVIF